MNTVYFSFKDTQKVNFLIKAWYIFSPPVIKSQNFTARGHFEWH